LKGTGICLNFGDASVFQYMNVEITLTIDH